MSAWLNVRYFLEDIWFEAKMWRYSRPARAVQRNTSKGKRKLVKAATRFSSANKRARRSAKLAIIASLPGASNVGLPDPPVPKLLLNNDPPADFELVLIKDAIRAALEAARHWSDLLQRQNERKTRAWTTTTRFKVNQANLFVRQHEGIISAVRKLPVEIVQEILLWTRNTTLTPRFSPIHFGKSDIMTPWILGQVCRRWRTIALNLPTLWCCLPTISLANSNSRMKLQLHYVAELLRRSGGASLEFTLSTASFNGATHPIIDLMCEHAERWESVSLRLDGNTLFHGLRSIKGRLPALRFLVVKGPSTGGEFALWNLHTTDCFSKAPLLTTVKTEGQIRQMFSLPFDQVIHFHENLASLNTSITATLNYRILQSLSLVICADEFTFPATTLPCLVVLNIICEFGSLSESFDCFDNVTIPAIETMKILTPSANMLPSVTRMLSNSSPCMLTKLDARFNIVDRGNFTQLLLHTPQLSDLTITMPSHESDIYDLSLGHMGQPLVPLLRSCDFVVERGQQCDVSMATSIIQLASTRCEPRNGTFDDIHSGDIRCLEHLCIHFDTSQLVSLMHPYLEDYVPTSCFQELKTLRQELCKIPSMHEMHYSRGPFNLSGRDWNNQVNQILTKINNLPMDDGRCIFFSGISGPLHKIANIRVRTDAKNVELAKAILAKWHPIMYGHNSNKDRHWQVAGVGSTLVYITNDSEYRKSPVATANFNYGLYADDYSTSSTIYYDY